MGQAELDFLQDNSLTQLFSLPAVLDSLPPLTSFSHKALPQRLNTWISDQGSDILPPLVLGPREKAFCSLSHEQK